MNEELCLKLIEFNKQKSKFGKTEVIRAKIYGGARLISLKINSSLGGKQVWDDLENHIDIFDKDKKHIIEFRNKFSKYDLKEILNEISKLYLKPGYIHNRKLIKKKPKSLPLDSTIFCWSEAGYSHASSNMIFYFAGEEFSDNIYYAKAPYSIEQIICKENKIR